MPELETITYPCSIDNSLQPAFRLLATGSAPRPLLVALHTWSWNFEKGVERYVELCRVKNWHLIYPDFRGPNNRPESCGSDLVVADITDAAIYMQREYAVDPARVYLSGGSGGGHATLLLAGRRPDIWAAASAWCPISDIAAWHRECLNTRFHAYAEHIELACGGSPLNNAKAWAEALKRSPLTWLKAASALPLDINTGIHDGHTGSVPVSQAIHAFNLLADPRDRISQQDLQMIVDGEKVPEHLRWPEQDPSFGPYTVYLRKQSRNVRLTLFEGGHDLLTGPAFEWLDQQAKGREAVWATGKAGPENTSAGNELSR